MKFQESVTYMMPVAFGPQPPHPAGEFTDVRTLMVIYRSTPAALARVLTEPFVPGPEPLVYGFMQRCRGVNFLAGGEYRLFGFNVAATFPADEGPIHGSFALILWENKIEPIIRGREILGIPKLLADVDDPEPAADRWTVSAWDRDHELIRMDLTDEEKMSSAEVDGLRAELAGGSWFGWKRIPSIDGIGVEVSQPTMIGIVNNPTSGWSCKGAMSVGDVSWVESPTNSSIVAGLRAIPLLECIRAYRTEGTMSIIRAHHRILT